MSRLPDYVGVAAFGVKMGVILPGCDLVDEITQAVEQCDKDGLLDHGDVLCVTESVVARSQRNYVTANDIAVEVQEKLRVNPSSVLGVLFPIVSRNRFSLVLEGFARAVCKGKIVLQLAYPDDEVGNQIIPDSFVEEMGADAEITMEDIGERSFPHPATGVDYIRLYTQIVQRQGADIELYLANDPKAIAKHDCDAVIICDIHTREQTRRRLKDVVENCITLQELCSDRSAPAWSEWGLLGSNLSTHDQLKLAPRTADEFALKLQKQVLAAVSKRVEVLVYGDGAYKDPSTHIYELADPRPVFGSTPVVSEQLRKGLKYKFFADTLHEQGKTKQEIEQVLEEKRRASFAKNSMETEGTTPRRMEDILASLADLVSGSSDAGTPLVIVKGFLPVC